MKRLFAGLMIAILLSLSAPATATYSGFGTDTPFDSGGGPVTSEVIDTGKVTPPKPAKKKPAKKTKKKTQKKKKKASVKKKKSSKKKKPSKKTSKKSKKKKPASTKPSTPKADASSKTRKPHVFKEEVVAPEAFEPATHDQAIPEPPDTLPAVELPGPPGQ